MKETITDQHGKVVGYKLLETNGSTYLTAGGGLVARVRNGVTTDAKNLVRGTGDQGMRLFGKK
jgi:hypothetical protein